MKVVKKAVMKFPDQREQKIALFQVEKAVFRWTEDPSGRPVDGVDYLSEHDAIKGIRVLVEGDPAYVGVDLTIYPVAAPAEERAARRIVLELDLGEIAAHLPDIIAIDQMADIIRQETGVDKLVEAANLLLTYEIPRRLQPKRPGLDMAWGGLALGVLEALEITTQVDLTNLKQTLSQGVEQVKVYSAIPGTKAVN